MLQIENSECLPDLICICCQTELREAIRFRNRVIEAQQELLVGLTEEQLREIPVEYRDVVMEMAGNSSQKGTNYINSESESECKTQSTHEEHLNLIIATQPKEFEKCENQNGKQEDLMEYDIIIDNDLIKEEAEEQEGGDVEVVTVPNDEHQFTVEATVDYILPDKESDEECAMLDRVLNDEIAVAQNSTKVKKNSGRNRHGSLVFICNECGNHISGRMAFDLHCRRHRGDKQFECE